MTNFPFHKQLDQMDCGAACIKMIADYYKENIPNKLYLAMYNWKVEIDD